MSKSLKKTTKNISLKKETYQQLSGQLATSLAWLKELIGEKKFESRIKKAARLLSNGIKQKAPKKIRPEKKVSKKKPEIQEPVIEK
ncbi:MAG TPA: hypothetical protein VJ111_12845 [Chitinophagaceae bacterium]|nr:hypothetical protein [Chitinophagaceae bacterium]